MVDANTVIRAVQGDSSITIYPPDTLAQEQIVSLAAITDLAIEAAIGSPFDIVEGEQSEITVDSVVADRYDFFDETGETIPLFILARHLDEMETPLLIVTIASRSEIETATVVALNIARTIHRPPSLPSTLENHAGHWQSAITELEQHELIETGGTLIFEESHALFLGEGDWITILAARDPHSNVVMAGTLRFRPGNIGEDETCGLLTRIVTDSEGKASAWLNVGIDNDHEVYYLDQINSVQQVGSVAMPNFDLEGLHRYLLIARDNTVTVYVDGQLIIQEATITSRSGSYGIALRGHGPNALCEGLNIWAYGLPSSAPQACIISASRPANKRNGPSTRFARIGRLERGTLQNAIGKIDGSDGFVWWQLDDESWVRSDVVSNQGDCDNLPTP